MSISFFSGKRFSVFSFKSGLLFFVAALLAMPEAYAQQERRSRRYEDVATQLGERKERELDTTLQEDLEREPVEREEARPALDFEQFRRTVELQVSSKRRSQIDTLLRIIQLGPSREEAPDLIFRLAELYWEEARFNWLQYHAKDDEIFEAQSRNDHRAAAAAEAEKASLQQESDDYRVKSIEQYRIIVREYPEYERLDEVLFSLGTNLWESAQPDEALRVFAVLIQRFPDSVFVADAYLAVAEHHFREGNIRVAQRGYERAVEFTESRVYGYALYKLGWCVYNLGEYEEAADLWKSVVYYGELSTELGGESKMALVREARRDYVLAYSHFGHPNDAVNDFKNVGGEENWLRMFRMLAGLYYDDAKHREAIQAYRILIDLDPLSPEAPLFQARIVDSGQRLGNKRFTVNQAKVLVEIIEDVKESGRIQTDDDRRLMEEAENMAERTLRTLAVAWHSEARKTRAEDTYWFAYELYRDYLLLFSHTVHEYQMRFYLAELLFYLENWAEAGEQYIAVIGIDAERMEGKRLDEDGNPEEVGEYLADAALSAVHAFEELVREFDRTEEIPDVEPPEIIEMPPPRVALMEACALYLKYVPDGRDFIAVTYMMANTFYRYNMLEEAVEKFAIIALENPDHHLAIYSANLILDSFNLLDRPDKVNKWARKMAANRVLAEGEFGKELWEIIAESALTMTERVAEAGNYAEAAEAYEAFVEEFPGSRRADTALFNASVNWANAGNLQQALALRARIISDYPDSDLVPEAIYSTATGYESMIEWEKATEYYEMYFEAYYEQHQSAARARGARRGRHARGGRYQVEEGGEHRYEESKAQESLFQAAILREGLGDYPRSTAHRLRYVELWPESDESRALFLSVAELYEREKDWPRAARHLRQYMERYGGELGIDGRLLMEYRRINLLEKAGHVREVERAYDEVRAIFRSVGSDPERLEGGLLPVAHAEIRSLEADFEAYTRVGVEYPWRDRMSPVQLTSRLQSRPSEALANRLRQAIEASDNGFRSSLENKSNELQKVVAAYTRVVQYRQGEPALCALEKIGDAYHNFIETLNDAPSPPYLQALYELELAMQGEEAREGVDLDMTFRDALAEQAFPLEEQAVEAWAAAVENARQLGIYTDCARRSLEKVRRVRPQLFPVVVELHAEPKIPLVNHISTQGFLTDIIEIPEDISSNGSLPADVASLPRLDGSRRSSGSGSRGSADRPGRGRTSGGRSHFDEDIP